jgi:hypothetical protein
MAKRMPPPKKPKKRPASFRDAVCACNWIAGLVLRKEDLVSRQQSLKKVERALDRAFEKLDQEEQKEISRG